MLVRPVLVLQFSPHVKPGLFGEYLTNQQIPWALIRVDLDEPLPASIDSYAALGLMGGEMSVNDPLPWIPLVCELIREADRLNRPVIGHCLGGQLMAKAFGAQVKQHVRKELGWSTLNVMDPAQASYWLGQGVAQLPTFQWHGDTFDIPAQAIPLLTNDACANQAYVVDRGAVKHLGMQCHMEMTPELVRSWTELWSDEIRSARAVDDSAVQTEAEILADLEEKCASMQTHTLKLYDAWARGLSQPA